MAEKLEEAVKKKFSLNFSKLLLSQNFHVLLRRLRLNIQKNHVRIVFKKLKIVKQDGGFSTSKIQNRRWRAVTPRTLTLARLNQSKIGGNSST
jgi:hypothetical protein